MPHSILAPSSAQRRVNCPGSRALEEQFPNVDSEVSRVGEAAHWVASQTLEDKINGCMLTREFPSRHENGELITNEMIEGANLYADYILKINGGSLYDPYSYGIEKTIKIDSVHPECYGTPDAWIIDENEVLHVFDYKFGFKYVEVFENYQLLEYAIGLSKGRTFNKIILHIVQPRSYGRNPIRQWELSFEQLYHYSIFLQKVEYEAMQPNALCVPNPECGFCKGRFACEALKNTTQSIVEMVRYDSPKINDPFILSKELSHLKNAAELLDARITGLEEQAICEIKNGENIPGYRLESLLGREKWKESPEIMISIAEAFEINIKKPQEIITPRQAIKKGLAEEIVIAFSERQNSALKLVKTDLKYVRKLFQNS